MQRKKESQAEKDAKAARADEKRVTKHKLRVRPAESSAFRSATGAYATASSLRNVCESAPQRRPPIEKRLAAAFFTGIEKGFYSLNECAETKPTFVRRDSNTTKGDVLGRPLNIMILTEDDCYFALFSLHHWLFEPIKFSRNVTLHSPVYDIRLSLLLWIPLFRYRYNPRHIDKRPLCVSNFRIC